MTSKPVRLLLWIGLPVLAIALGIAYTMTRKQERTFFTSKVEKGDVTSVVQATGTINAVHSVLVGSQVSGNIDKLYADFNYKVKKGDVIARIEPSLFQASVDQAKADMANAAANQQSLEVQVQVAKADIATQKANMEKARATMTQSRLALGRSKDLTAQGISPQSQLEIDQANFDANSANFDAAKAFYEQSQAKLQSQIAQVEQAKAQVAQKKAALAAAQVNLDHTIIYVPINGTVVARSVDVGQTVAAAMQAPTLFTIAEDLTKMQVDVATDESDVGNLRTGGTVFFKVDAFPKDTFQGAIREVRMNATTVQNVVTYDTVVDFQNPDLKLLPGMTAYITIPVSEAKNVLKLPNGAVRFRPDIPDDERKAALDKIGIKDGGGKNKGLASGGPGAGAGGGDAGASASTGSAGSGMQSSPDGAMPGQRGGMQSSPDGAMPGQRGGMGGDKGRGGRGGMGGDKGGDKGGRGGMATAKGGPGGGGAGAAAAAIPASAISVKPARGAVEVHTIWKLVGDKQMEPVQVRTSITDYTFTACLEVLKGTLNEGDNVITGMAIPNRASTGQFGQPGRGGAPGGFGGAGGGRGPGR